MKYLLLAAGLMLSPFLMAEASANDFQVAIQRKKVTGPPGVRPKKSTETIYYEVSVTNRAFNRESAEVEAHYVIFVERQELGEIKGTEQTERIRGTVKVPAMRAQGKEVFDTATVGLRSQAHSGFCYYTNGGRTRAVDSLSGVWIKLYQNGEEVGEYINPTTLRNKMKWD